MAQIDRASTAEENFFNTGADNGDPRVSETNTYVDSLSTNKYEFMDAAYYGTGGFRDGSYLIPHDREMFYRKRRGFSVFKNFIRPIVNSLVDPVFAEPAPRVIIDADGGDTGSPIARAFIEDVDGGGTSLQSFSRGVMHMARRHGVTFILMDNFPLEQMPATVQEAVSARIYPYMVKKAAWEVVEVKTDDFGRLEEIGFAEPDRVDGHKRYKRARLWTSEYSILIEKPKESLNVATGQKAVWEPASAPIYHNLGVVPVVTVYACERDSLHDTLPDPPLYDVARLNHLIYNKDSEIRDLERSQAFSILYFQSDVGGNVTLSNHNAILVPPGSTVTPGYISPDSGQLTALVENNKYYQEDLFRSAEQSGVHAVRTSMAASGVALAWRFWAVENALKETARMATVYEVQAMDMLMLYTGEQFTYGVEYPVSYQPGDQASQIANLKAVIDMDPPEILRVVVFKKVVNLLMADMPEDEREAVIASLEVEPVAPPEPTQPTEPTPEVQTQSPGGTATDMPTGEPEAVQ